MKVWSNKLLSDMSFFNHNLHGLSFMGVLSGTIITYRIH